MPFPEDLDQFLREGDFATPCELRLQGGSVRRFSAIFDEQFLDAETGEYRFETSSPRLNGKAADMAGVRRGDSVVLDPDGPAPREFDVVSAPQIDGTGWAVLRIAPKQGQGGR